MNKDKCHFLFAGYKHEHLWVNVGGTQIWESSSQKILGVIIDRNLKFEEHVGQILAVAGRKLTALATMTNVLTFSKLRLLIKSFVVSQFSYCLSVWMLCSRTLNKRINKLQERALRILYHDYISSFTDLLEKDNSITVHDHNIQILANEMYKM